MAGTGADRGGGMAGLVPAAANHGHRLGVLSGDPDAAGDEGYFAGAALRVHVSAASRLDGNFADGSGGEAQTPLLAALAMRSLD